jgi:hypothetical protein
LFELFVKQSFSRQAVAHLLKGDAQGACAHGVERLDDQFVFAARFVNRKTPAHAHL